jgi:hypothetical protein
VARGKGSPKTFSKAPHKYFGKKSMSKTFYKKIDKNFHVRCQFLHDFLIAFLGVSQPSAMGVQKHYKINFVKNIVSKVEKFLQKIEKKIQKPIFFLIFFITFLGVSQRG